MAVKKIFIVTLTVFFMFSSIFVLSGCGDDEEDSNSNSPSYTTITLTKSNYTSYIGFKVTNKNWSKIGTSTSGNMTYTVETYSLNDDYEFEGVSLQVSNGGGTKTLSKSGYASFECTAYVVFSYYSPSPTAISISGKVRKPN